MYKVTMVCRKDLNVPEDLLRCNQVDVDVFLCQSAAAALTFGPRKIHVTVLDYSIRHDGYEACKTQYRRQQPRRHFHFHFQASIQILDNGSPNHILLGE